MSDSPRQHWSIGEVLNLLQDEFPEVTISKIRFLEGQGLIDPERTPSGYRRFYPEDFDRLRWVLIQQRDHYLPLRVIRERLDSGEVVFIEGGPFPETGPQQRTLSFEDDTEDERFTSSADQTNARSTVAASETAQVAMTDVASGEFDAEAALGDATPDEATSVAPTAETQGTASQDSATDQDAASTKDAASAKEAGSAKDAGSTNDTASADHTASTKDAASTNDTISAQDVGDGEQPRSASHQADHRVQRATARDVSLTRDELIAESGCSSALVSDLERHGLVVAKSVGSSILYDADALEITVIAQRFAVHGLDPRHLRSFRLAAEREVGLFAQIVGPQFHRKAPAARQESLDVLHDLGDLAGSLRSILLGQMLRDEFPGA